MQYRQHRFPVFFGVWMVGCAVAAAAEAAPVRIDGVRIGFAGHYKVGHWTPVLVTLAGGDRPVRGQVTLAVPDGDGIETTTTTRSERPVDVPARGKTSVLLYAKFGRVRGSLTAAFLPEHGRTVARSFRPRQEPSGPDRIAVATPADGQLVVTVGRPIGAEAVRVSHRKVSERMVAALVPATADLPDRWWGYAGVDTLILTGSRPEIYDAMTRRQIEAVDLWVRMGGRMIVCVGAHGRALLGTAGKLARFAPGHFAGTADRPTTAGLETFAGATRRPGAGDREADFKMTLLEDVRGQVEVREEASLVDWPAIIHSTYGFGRITFVTLDLDDVPFTKWEAGRRRLVAKLLAEMLDDGGGEDFDRPHSSQAAHLGYDDLAGQLRGALDRFRGVTVVRFWWIAALVVLYIVLIGPVDYFLLRRFARRREWAWLTFPLVVTAFCVVAYVLVARSKGNRLRINQVDVVDVDIETSLVRGTTWAHVYSPKTDELNLTLEPAVAGLFDDGPGGVLLSWQGLPGEALGGMNTATGAALVGGSYRIEARPARDGQPCERLALENMPIQVASTKSLVGRWWGDAKIRSAAGLTAGPDKLLHGEVENLLPIELTRCFLYFDRWAYQLDRLAPGQRVSVDALPSPRNLQWLLTERTLVDMRSVTTPWDRGSVDMWRILQIMMFHEAAGGRAYTGLLDRYQGFVDLSRHLKTGRAVLVGRAESPASELERDGRTMRSHYDRHWTQYRLVFPVEVSSDRNSRSNQEIRRTVRHPLDRA